MKNPTQKTPTLEVPATEPTNDKPQVLPFQLITGGKGGGDGSPWLGNLPIGTVFLSSVKPRGTSPEVGVNEFHVVYHTNSHTKLLDNLNQEVYLWVNTRRFSNVADLVDILYQPADKQEEE